ncbi:unnamed protein product [Plutella xylostella]|uniref:(diamondback moth) hypothetical protein n=1 Tax=Plutella xylostella TaxID=51655 RepID=A0A8S4E8X4_PLUXY|nr:unnamed protein product [Plutella xylostella]
MDKNIYETYEFLPSNSHESETDQFFVVQNDGTLLINRQVQYVTQVEDVKGVLENAQPCAVYDVSSQQYFVDVDNSTELITVSDQYVLPENSGNVYENNFLLQSIPDAPTVQMSEDMAVSDLVPAHSELKNEQTDEAATAQPPDTNNLTEITITDDQYHMLEQKGWVMLNVNEKVFLLNALGLHDITGNDKLIQQLKNDIQIFMDLQAAPMESNPVLDEIPIVPLKAKENGFITPNDSVPMKPASQEHISGNKDKIQEPHNKHEQTTQPTLETVKNENEKSSDTKKLKRNSTVIRLKTNYSVKDIPDRIVLGKTKNGKRLVAKIIDVVPPTASPCSNNIAPGHDQSKPPPGSKLEPEKEMKDSDDSSVERLVELALRGGGATCAAGDVRAAEAVVRRLRRACRQPSANRDLVVTTVCILTTGLLLRLRDVSESDAKLISRLNAPRASDIR